MYDMIVIGGGPAALSAACYAQGKKLQVALIFEDLGGKVGWLHSPTSMKQEHELPGNDVVHLLMNQATQHGRLIIHDQVLHVTQNARGFRVATQDHGVLDSSVVLVATGTSPLRLRVSGAERFVGHGLNYSIPTFGHLVAGQRIVVVAASRRALRGTLELARLAARVAVVVPEPAILATPLGAMLRHSPTVEIFEGYEVTELCGGNRLERLLIACGGETAHLDVDQVFVDLGLVPHSEPVQELVETDALGCIVVNARHETATPGLYAAGDVTTIPCEQVLVAVGDGARAAMYAYEYMLTKSLVDTVVFRNE